MVNFKFGFDSGTSLQQMVGFEIAGRLWSSYLTDNTTVNLQVGVSSSLGSNIIGGALPGMLASSSYSDYRNKLAADSTSADDKTAVNSLNVLNPGATYWSSFDLFADGTPSGTNSRQAGSTTTINMTRADAKAVGINLADGATALDGYILFSNLSGQSKVSWNYDYTRSQPMAANSLDFLSTAVHEIGHVLGFVSGIDAPGWLNSTVSWGASATSYKSAMDNRIDSSTPLDLFRYSADSTSWPATDFSYGSWGGDKYLSLDKGKTAIASFATGTDTSIGGSGEQASHWEAGTAGIMAPTLKTGTRSNIGSVDLRALDAIGWNLASNGINTSISLSSLQAQAQQALASRLGKTTSWLTANATTAAQQLAQNHSQDVYTMAVNSQIYDLSRISPGTGAGTTSLTFNQLFQERGLFETLDELEVPPTINIQPSLQALGWDVVSNLTRLSPPTPGVPPTVIITLPSLDLTRLSPPTPGVPPTVIITLPSLDLTRLSPPTPGVPPAVIITLPSLDLTRLSPPTPGVPPAMTSSLPGNPIQSVQALTSGTTATSTSGSGLLSNNSYFYGHSQPVAYKGAAQPAQQPLAPLTVLVDLRAAL